MDICLYIDIHEPLPSLKVSSLNKIVVIMSDRLSKLRSMIPLEWWSGA